MKPIPSICRPAPSTVAAITVVALLAATFAASASPASAQPPATTYTFEQLSALPQPAPSIPGKFLARDFEIGNMTNSGRLFWAADFNAFASQPPWQPAEGEGIWMQRPGESPELVAASGGQDPEGVTYSTGFPGPITVNEVGDGAFAFRLLPPPTLGASNVLNAGLYRYDAATGEAITVAKSCRPPYVGCGPFAGFNFGVHLNGRGDLSFQGVTKTTAGTYANPEDGGALYGAGIYVADRDDDIKPAVVPGDPAPNGFAFDNLRNSWQNDRGDVAFGGHTKAPYEAPCTALSCAESVYVKDAATGSITSVAHRGETAPVPGGLVFDYAFGPRINNRGDIVFVGCIKPPTAAGCGSSRGVFLYSGGSLSAVAYPGQVFAAEGNLYTAIRAANIVNNYFVNDGGEVVFSLMYDADANADGIKDTGVFKYANGTYEVVAATGDVIAGVGTVAHTSVPADILAGPPPSMAPRGPVAYTINNNRGDVAFQVTLTDGTGALLVAHP